jgi:1-acyl-sn-glycerol-3-phosphate acyltransferase
VKLPQNWAPDEQQGMNMTENQYSMKYPRKRLARFLIRLLGRIIMPIFFELEIAGQENFPSKGPLLVVGNHTAAMEAVMLNVYSRTPIEMLGAADTPAEMIVEVIGNLYGMIPIHRGSYDRAAMRNALDVLKQGGLIGLFPEGGIWEEGKKKALPGIAWLSIQSGAPVLPIGFNDTSGAMNAAFKFKRPKLTMQVGQILPTASKPPGKKRKEYLQEYADQVMEAVHQLVPQDQYTTEPEIVDERFKMNITILDQENREVYPPEHLQVQEAIPLATFFHRPAILKIFKINLDLPVDPIQQLASFPSVPDLIIACKSVLDYLSNENPYLLTYRFGVKGGLAMESGIQQLVQLLLWCQENEYKIKIKPTRIYYSLKEGHEIQHTEQGSFQSWM